MHRVDKLLQIRALLRQKLESQAILFGGFNLAFPAIKRGNGAVDLHTNGPALLDRGLGDRLGLGPAADGAPRDKHAAKSCRPGRGGKREYTLDVTGLWPTYRRFHFRQHTVMRDDYIKDALKVIPDPNLLINVVSHRVKQLKRGNRPLVESLEKLSSEDVALREIIEGKISHEMGDN